MFRFEEEVFFDDDFGDMFGKSEDEDDFVGFNFTLLDDINQEINDDRAKIYRFYNENFSKVFC